MLRGRTTLGGSSLHQAGRNDERLLQVFALLCSLPVTNKLPLSRHQQMPAYAPHLQRPGLVQVASRRDGAPLRPSSKLPSCSH